MKFLALLISTILTTSTFAAPNLATTRTADATINISVQGIVGPSFDNLLHSYHQIFKATGIRVVDMKVTGVNGYGTPMAGYIKTSTPIPEGAALEQVSYSVDCMWGNIFSQAQTYLNMIKIQNGQVVSFVPTSHNGYGKPCSATIGFVRRPSNLR